MDPVVDTFGSLLNNVGALVTKTIDWIGDYAEAITDSPILVLSCVAVPLVGLGIRALSRLMSRKV